MKLIGAWEKIDHNKDFENVKLILVGGLGWNNDNITAAMKPWQ